MMSADRNPPWMIDGGSGRVYVQPTQVVYTQLFDHLLCPCTLVGWATVRTIRQDLVELHVGLVIENRFQIRIDLKIQIP